MPAPVVGITADRRWQEQADLFRRRGIEVQHGPTMRTIDLAIDAGLREATDALIASPPQWLVATTGAGVRSWLDAAERWGQRDTLLSALRQSRIIARGAKAQSALRQAGLEVEWRAPRESMADVVEHLRAQGPEIAGARVAVQLFDPDDHPSTGAIRSLCGSVVEVPVYRWVLPDDTRPAERLVGAAVAGDLAAVTFTSQPAVRFLFSIAESIGSREALTDACNRGPVLTVCIGEVCAEAGAEVGLTRMVWPDTFRLPPMVRLVDERLGATRAEDPAP